MSTPVPRSIPLEAAATLLRQLSYLAEGGLTPAEAVAVLKEDATAGGPGAVLAELGRNLEEEDRLSAAFERHAAAFGAEAVALIRTAEERNTLPGTLALLADDYEGRLQIRKGLPAILFWPVFLLGFLALLTALLLIFVIPAFKEVYASFGADLPGLTLVVMAISDFVVAWWFILLPLLIALAMGMAWLRRRPGTGTAIDGFVLQLPGVRRFLLKLLAGRTSALLAGAAANDIPFAAVIAYMRSTLRNLYLRDAIAELERDLAHGTPFAAAWRKQALLPRGLAQMVDIGQRSGRLQQVLARAAHLYQAEAAEAVLVFRNTLLIAAYILAAIIVGFTVIAMYLPIFKLGMAV